MDISDDWFSSLGTYFGRLEPYPACGIMDADRIETSENNQATWLLNNIEY
jgi:hypothetical protein